MKVLALYVQPSLSLLRRVMAPYSTLAQRGYPFTFQSVPTLASGLGMAYGHDLVVLPNWVLSPEEVDLLREVSRQKVFCYDLSDPALLEKEEVRRTLACCRVISVPNSHMRDEVKVAVPLSHVRVMVLPSLVDVPYFMGAHTRRKLTPPVPTIGCFGPHDWHLVKEVLQELRAEGHPSFSVIGDRAAHQVLGPLCEPREVTVGTYPSLLGETRFGLCPREGRSGEDTIWLHEYGIMDRPVIASADSSYVRVSTRTATRFVLSREKEAWKQSILLFLRDAHIRASYGHQAAQQANEQRATVLVKPYLQLVRQILPQSLALR